MRILRYITTLPPLHLTISLLAPYRYRWLDPDNHGDLDFAYDPAYFGNHSFVHPSNSTVPNATTSGPVELFAHFHKDLNMKFGGIRKPRTYSNFALSNTSGWLLPNSFDVGAGDSNWNMSAAGWSDWYVAHHLHFLRDGLDYWCEFGFASPLRVWTYTQLLCCGSSATLPHSSD